jgi:GT2 family glycosyltransferase
MQRVMVVEAVRSIMNISTYRNFEFVFVVDATTPAVVQSELRAMAGERATFVQWLEPFSFSRKVNLGVLQARGEFVLILNDDVELITPDWIESMLALAQLPRAGTVGAMLYFEDDKIQHAGHAYYRLNVTHIGLNSERGAAGPFGGFLVEREVAGNTAACCMMTRELFLKAGGFSTLLPGNFNDVDLCLKISTLGYQSYWTPFAELHHFESKSRDPRVSASEVRTTWGRWEHLLYASDLWPTDPHEGFIRERPPQL